MTKEKQIEEMAEVINTMDEQNAHYYDENLQECEAFANCDEIAEALYNAGYRKASDIINEVIDFLFEVEKLESLYAGQREARGVRCAINKLKEKYKVDVKNG